MKEEIFKAYDIRGVYGEDVKEEDLYKIGRAFVFFLNKKNPRIIAARDGRSSSPSLFSSLKEGVMSAGGTVVDIGLASTPLTNFAVKDFDCDGGLMVTASHSPPEVNGIKMIKGKALQMYGEEIKKVKDIVEKDDFERKEGSLQKVDPLPFYLEHLSSLFPGRSDLRFVLDFGSGVASVAACPFFDRRGDDVTYLYEEVDGNFPGHLPDPLDEDSYEEIRKKMKEEKVNLGALFDGDGDRCIVLDEKGEVVSIDKLFMLLAKEELKEKKGEKVYYDLRFSMATKETVESLGGVPVMMRVGNPFYKEKLILEGGVLGGELSGHLMFKDNFAIDDGLFAFLKVLKIVSESGKNLSELLSPYSRYFQTKELNFKVRDKEKALRKARERFNDGEEISLDGVYIRYSDWWFNLRASNTEDLVRLRIEAKEEKLLEEKKEVLTSLLSSC